MQRVLYYFLLLPLLLGADTPVVETPPAETPIPSHQEIPVSGDSYEPAFIKMLLTLGGILLLVFLTIWALRRLTQGKGGGFGGQKRIKILEKRPLSPKSILYLVEVGERQVLIAESQVEVRALTVLSELDADDR